MQSPAISFYGSAEPVEAFLPVYVVAHDRLPLVAAGDHVVQGTRKLDSQRSRHAPTIHPSSLHAERKRRTAL